MNILHATTNPDLLTRLKQMLDSANRADIAVGYFFISGFGEVADRLSRLDRVRILVGRTDRPTLEAVALGLQQQEALRSRQNSDSQVQRRHRAPLAQNAVDNIAAGVATLPQADDAQQAVAKLRESGRRWVPWRCVAILEGRSTPRRISAGTTTTPSPVPP